MDISKILSVFYRDQEWAIKEEDYEFLEWGESNSIPKPTLEELQDKWDNQRGEIDDLGIQQTRKMEILSSWPIEKQFEAITEFHMGRPDKMDELVAHIQAVKDSHPKSTS